MFTLLETGFKTFEFTEAILPSAVELAEGMSYIGVGIGAVMLLIVTIYHIIKILEGNKFEMKMLVPLLIFFVVCNFGWAAKPVLRFTTTMTRGLTTEVVEAKNNMLNPDGTGEISTVNDYYRKYQMEDDITNPNSEENMEDPEDAQGAESGTKMTDESSDTFADKLIDMAISKINSKVQSDFATTGSEEVRQKNTIEGNSWVGICATMWGWIASLFAAVLKIFGSFMTCVVVGFGPITFAFAMIPGKAQNIMSWFIRICQFALFGPIVYFLEALIAHCYVLFTNDGASFFQVCVFEICFLVALLSTPTIASMIIEGAQGAVSLSQGLMTIFQTYSITSAITRGTSGTNPGSGGGGTTASGSGGSGGGGGGTPSGGSGGTGGGTGGTGGSGGGGTPSGSAGGPI